MQVKLLGVVSALLLLSSMVAMVNAVSSNMKVKILTDKSVYVKGDKIRFYVHAKDLQGNAVGNALVQLIFKQGSKSYAMQRTFTDSDGVAFFQVKLSKHMNSGEYLIFALVTKPGFNEGTGLGKFYIF
jgi:uncharacterized protein YfaS (alpha-2-macroglobulin family)